MKKLFFFLFAFLIQSFAIATPVLTGSWQGAIKASGIELGVVFKFSTAEENYLVKMDVPLQGAKDIPGESVVLKGDSLSFSFSKLNGTYRGKFASANQISGEWTQNGKTFELTLKSSNGVEAVIKRPQEPKAPFSYENEEVIFENKTAGIKLAGTFTYPRKQGVFPAVVLISGSGPQDRDEQILGHKPFLLIADELTKAGFAVLRFDDRGTNKSGGDYKTATSEDFSTDVESAIKYLKARKEVGKIGLMGHSEGAMIAPMVASRNKEVSFIVLLAGPGLAGKELLALQSEALLAGSGKTKAEINKTMEFNRLCYDLALSNKKADSLKYYVGKGAEKLGVSDSNFVKSTVIDLSNPWMKYFLKYDPALVLNKVKCPVLAINGSSDLQVVCDPNLAGIESALKKAGNKDFTLHKFEGLNHLFQHSKTGMPSEYSQIEETFAPEALDYIKDWLKKENGIKN